MKRAPRFIHLLVPLLLMALPSLGQRALPALLTGELHGYGYENLASWERHDTLFVSVENRKYRWDARACAEVLDILMPCLPTGSVLYLVMLRQGIPMTAVIMPRDAWSAGGRVAADSVRTTMMVPGHASAFIRKRMKHLSFNKPELVIYPQVKIQLGNFDDPFQSQFNIAPALGINFARGLHFTAQVIIPVQNDLEPAGNSVRPGIIVLSQTLRLPGSLFARISAGYFTRDRYGVNAEFRKYFFNGRLSAGMQGGFTGYAALAEGRWTYTGIDLFTWFSDLSYRWADYDLTIQAGAGRFGSGGYGWRADAYRQFGEVTIGLFALGEGNFLNGGFTFRVPLPPGRYSTRHVARIRPADYFSYEYRARGLQTAGKSYDTGESITDLFHNINPDYLRKYLVRSFFPYVNEDEKNN